MKRYRAIMILAALCVTVVAMALISTQSTPPKIGVSSLWGPSIPVSSAELFELLPRPEARLLDEELYLGTLQLMRQGGGFYQSQNEMFNRNPGRWNTTSPLSYRQPLTTYLWLLLGNGVLIAAAWSLMASASMIAAYYAATRLVGPWAALVGPIGLALIYSLLLRHPPRILYTEMWAAPPLVAAGALCALSLTDCGVSARRSWLTSVSGAVCALVALLFRELSLLVVGFILISLLVDTVTRKARLWIPYVAAVAVWVVGYLIHAARVADVSRMDPVPPDAPSYFQPGVAFLAACFRWASATPEALLVIAVLSVSAVIGAFLAPTAGLRVLAGGSTVAVIATLMLVGTPGVFADGSYTGYWGYLFVPVIVAWSSLGALAMHRSRPLDRTEAQCAPTT